MAVFLTQAQLYLLIQRELPEDVYPHSGNPAAYFSTADSAAQAEMIAQLYEHLETAYDNQWPQHANADGIAHHESMRFGSISTGLSLSARQDRVLARMRALPNMSRPTLRALVEAELPPGTNVVIVNYNQEGPSGGMGTKWRLGVSQLGIDTYLGGGMRWPAGVDVCTQTPESGGLTEQQLLDMRENAYTYEVRIYDYTPTATELAAIETALNDGEKASVRHVIVAPADPSLAPSREFDTEADFFLPALESIGNNVHWVMDDANTTSETVASRSIALTLTLNSGGTYTKPDTAHPLTKGSATKRKYLSGTGIAADNNLASTSVIDLIGSGRVLSIEAVFRLQAWTAFYFRIIRNAVVTQRFDLYAGYDETSDEFYFLPLDILGAVDEGYAGMRTMQHVFDMGVAREDEYCHFACMIDARTTKPKFESYLNGELIGRSQSTRPFDAGWTSATETFSITDNAGDDTYRSFAEVMLHDTPLTLGLVRQRARYYRWLHRIKGV